MKAIALGPSPGSALQKDRQKDLLYTQLQSQAQLQALELEKRQQLLSLRDRELAERNEELSARNQILLRQEQELAALKQAGDQREKEVAEMRSQVSAHLDLLRSELILMIAGTYEHPDEGDERRNGGCQGLSRFCK